MFTAHKRDLVGGGVAWGRSLSDDRISYESRLILCYSQAT